jgi:hypothetical protein
MNVKIAPIARSVPTLQQSANLKAYKNFISQAADFLRSGKNQRRIVILPSRANEQPTIKLAFYERFSGRPGWNTFGTRSVKKPNAIGNRFEALGINNIEIETGIVEEDLQRLVNLLLNPPQNTSIMDGFLKLSSYVRPEFKDRKAMALHAVPISPVDPRTIKPAEKGTKEPIYHLDEKELLAEGKKINRRVMKGSLTKELRSEIMGWISQARAEVTLFNRSITRSSKRLPERYIYVDLLTQMQKFQRRLGEEPEAVEVLMPRSPVAPRERHQRRRQVQSIETNPLSNYRRPTDNRFARMSLRELLSESRDLDYYLATTYPRDDEIPDLKRLGEWLQYLLDGRNLALEYLNAGIGYRARFEKILQLIRRHIPAR